MKKENLIGRKFGRLLVIEEVLPAINKPKRPQWKCQCECGDIIIVHRGWDLKSGNTTSCGCWKKQEAARRASKRNFDGRKYDPRTATAKRVYDDEYRDGDLTFEQFLELSQQNCFYCDSLPSNIKKPRRNNYSEFYSQNNEFKYNGLDRLDNNFPHNYLNVVPCCKYCNYAKRERSVKEFYSWAVKLFNNINKKAEI